MNSQPIHTDREDISVKNVQQATECNKCECIGSPIYIDNYFNKNNGTKQTAK